MRASNVARRLALLAACGSSLGTASLARAEEEAGTEPSSSSLPPPLAARSAAAGTFLPYTLGARSDTQRGLVYAQGGYDGARSGGVYQLAAEAQLFGRLSVRAGGSYVGRSDENFRPEVGLRVDALRQETHGVDVAVLGAYEANGFNMVRAVTARVAVSRAFGATRLLGNVGYGFGLQDSEGYGDVRLAALRAIGPRFHVGLDSRLRIDLERDASEPAGEPDWELLAAPIATCSIDRFILSATAGYSALKYRQVSGTHAGVITTIGVGAVF